MRREEAVALALPAGASQDSDPWPPALAEPDLARCSDAELERMQAAAGELAQCQRVLERGGLNLVGEALRGASGFFEFEHYPQEDVFDRETGAQYYYHAHRGLQAEHGHFHLFLRARGMPEGVAPLPGRHLEPWPSGEDALAHLAAISMDAYGAPIGLFVPNRWVVDDALYPAADLVRMLDRFAVDHANPSWPLNRWLGAMLRLYRPHIEAMLHERERLFDALAQSESREALYERRDLDILAWCPVSPEAFAGRIDAERRLRNA